MPNSFSQPLPADLQNLDVHVLQAMLLAERAKVSALQEKLQSRDIEIERLGLLIAKLRRMTFGRSSEKQNRQIEQLEFQLEELQSDRAKEEIVAPQKQTPPGESDKKKPARRSLPEHLPRDTRTHEPDDKACPQCRGKLHYLGQDEALVETKKSVIEAGVKVKKSELLRIAIAQLNKMEIAQVQEALGTLTPVKAGRPTKVAS